MTLIACDGVQVKVPLDIVNRHIPVIAGIVEDLDTHVVPLVGLDGVATGKRVQLIVNALQFVNVPQHEADVQAFNKCVLGTFSDRKAMFELLEYLDIDVLKEKAAVAVATSLARLQSQVHPLDHQAKVKELLIGKCTLATASQALDPAYASPLPEAP